MRSRRHLLATTLLMGVGAFAAPALGQTASGKDAGAQSKADAPTPAEDDTEGEEALAVETVAKAVQVVEEVQGGRTTYVVVSHPTR